MHSYSNLASAVRKHSAAPAIDVAALFRHVVFNAAIGNVDDHLKTGYSVSCRLHRSAHGAPANILRGFWRCRVLMTH